VIYKSNGGAASADELIAWIQFADNKTANGSDILVSFNSSGIIDVTY
jgi:hypothetical protein